MFILPAVYRELIYGPDEVRDLAVMFDLNAPPQEADVIERAPELLADVDVIFSGWGAPTLDARFLTAAPQLKAVFYGAGSIKNMVTEAFWSRDILITSAYAANAVPVAEYTLSQVLWCLKRGWQYAREVRRTGKYPEKKMPVPGAFRSTVGLISLGMIGRKVCQLLKHFDVHVLAHDPFFPPAEAASLGVELCSLEDLFRRSDVVSLHTPWLKETEGMVAGRHFDIMKQGATFINTSRGAVVNEPEMIAVLQRRPDLFAVLDVTWPEPPVPGSPLYTLDNVVLTPHIAGSMDGECRRMGRYMVDEARRYLNGEPLLYGIDQKRAAILA
jgi:phosphoglycerate dehydrogenase-like enzyme